MWVYPATRRELVDLITPRGGGDVPGAKEEDRPKLDLLRPDMMAALWPAPPGEFGRMPTAIIAPEGDRRDTLAWLATYVRDYRPFTAYCRVIERPIADQFLKGPVAPTLRGMEGICSGLILGEALAHARGKASTLELPATAYSATLSHAISRTLALTGMIFPLDALTRLWTQARDLTGQSGLGVPPNLILSVWSVVLGLPGHFVQPRTLFDPPDLLSAAWTDLSSKGMLRDQVWYRLVEGYPDLNRMRGLSEIPREQRVEAIDLALRSLLSSRHGDEVRNGFLAGYFTSLLAPGTLDHAEFLAPVAATIPTAFLWYGAFAGLNPRAEALPIGNPLARRLVRDLTLPDRLVDRPRCDVAIEELALHGAVENLLRLSAKLGRIDVDLLPGVTSSVRWPMQEAPSEDELRMIRDMEVQHLLGEMAESNMRSYHLAERIREILRKGGTERQLPSKRKRGKP
jgi:hypothetical protein